MTTYRELETPIGRLILAGEDGVLQAIRLPDEGPDPEWRPDPGAFEEAARQIPELLRGERRSFNLAIDPRGTPFQKAVWKELVRVPYGSTISYGELAHRVGRPGAARAVGAANARNPLPIVIPCHRVIGGDGSLTGYGGGLPLKRRLLELEATG